MECLKLTELLESMKSEKPYKERKVDRYIGGDFIISTALVGGSEHPYETAIFHPAYNNGMCVVVEEYDTKDLAQIGHDIWVQIMTSKTLPAELHDVDTSTLALEIDDDGGKDWRIHKKGS